MLIGLLLLAAGCSRMDTLRLAHANGGTPLDWPADAAAVHLAIESTGEGRLWLPVSVDGSAPVPFLLQASAGAIALTGARPAGPGPMGAGSLSLQEGLLPGIEGGVLVRQRRLALEAAVLREQSLLLVDAAHWPHAVPGRVAAGVLGYDLFRRFTVELNASAGQLVLHRQGSFDFQAMSEVMRLAILDRRPYLEVQFAGPAGREQWLRLQFEPAEPVGVCLDARRRRATAVIAGVRFAIAEAPCPAPAPAELAQQRDGMLGAAALAELVVAVDYAGGRIGFRPRP